MEKKFHFFALKTWTLFWCRFCKCSTSGRDPNITQPEQLNITNPREGQQLASQPMEKGFHFFALKTWTLFWCRFCQCSTSGRDPNITQPEQLNITNPREGQQLASQPMEKGFRFFALKTWTLFWCRFCQCSTSGRDPNITQPEQLNITNPREGQHLQPNKCLSQGCSTHSNNKACSTWRKQNNSQEGTLLQNVFTVCQ